MLASDLALEHLARTDLLAAIAHCEAVQDYVSRDVLKKSSTMKKSTLIS